MLIEINNYVDIEGFHEYYGCKKIVYQLKNENIDGGKYMD